MKAWGVVAACVLVAGCSSGTSATHEAAKSKPKVAAVAQIDDAATIGRMIGCTTPMKRERDSMAQEEDHCRVAGEDVSITRAPDRATEAEYVQTASSFGVNVARVNDHWLVSSTSRPLVKQLAAKHHWQMF